MNDYYVYAWRRPDTDVIFYIGKGRKGRDNQTKDHNPIFMRIVNKLERLGLKPSVERVHENLSEIEAFELERQLIARYGRINKKTGTLANLTDGGEGASGVVVGLVTRQKLSASGLTAWEDQERRLATSTLQRKRFEDPEERLRNAEITRVTWQDETVREKRTVGVRIARRSGESRIRTSEISRKAPPTAANKSGFKGVFFSKAASKWTCQIKLDGKSKHLGLFPTPEEAARAYDAAAFAAWGADCYLNFPEDFTAKEAA